MTNRVGSTGSRRLQLLASHFGASMDHPAASSAAAAGQQPSEPPAPGQEVRETSAERVAVLAHSGRLTRSPLSFARACGWANRWVRGPCGTWTTAAVGARRATRSGVGWWTSTAIARLNRAGEQQFCISVQAGVSFTVTNHLRSPCDSYLRAGCAVCPKHRVGNYAGLPGQAGFEVRINILPLGILIVHGSRDSGYGHSPCRWNDGGLTANLPVQHN